MKHDTQSIDRLLKENRPPVFENPEHEAALLERLRSQRAAADEPAAAPSKTRAWENVMLFPTHKPKVARWRFAAAAVLVGLMLALFWGLGGRGANRALAATLQKLREARTMLCTVHVQGKEGPEISVKLAFKAPSIIRKEEGKGVTVLADLSQGKSLVLLHAEKKFMEMPLNVTSQTASEENLISAIRSMPLEAEVRLGARQIGGKEAQGFRTSDSGCMIESWVDLKNLTLLRVDFVSKAAPDLRLSLTDFQFDPPMDEQLFSFAPPAGYTSLAVPDTKVKPAEADLVALLGWFAKYSKSRQFPDSIDPVALGTQLRLVAETAGQELKAVPLDERIKIGLSLQRGLLFIVGMDSGAEWKYAGKGRSPKDGAEPIFWWRPRGADKYRIITAALQVKELGAKDFPKLVEYKADAVEISESSFGGSVVQNNDGEITIKGVDLRGVIRAAYKSKDAWLDIRVPESDKRYDVTVKVAKDQDGRKHELLRDALQKHFGLAVRREKRMDEVFVLSAPRGRTALLREPADKNSVYWTGGKPFKFHNMNLGGLAGALSEFLNKPVFDETRLAGSFDCELNVTKQPAMLAQAVREQLGLALIPARREVQCLIIEQPAATK